MLFQETADFKISKTSDQFSIQYESLVRDSLLHIDFEVSKVGSLSTIIDENIDVDLKGKKYLQSIYQKLQEKSMDSKYAKLTLQQAKELCLSLRNLIEETVKPMTKEQIKSPDIQGMYISLAFARSILKTKLPKSNLAVSRFSSKRALVSKTNNELDPGFEQPIYAQDVYEGYALGLSPFMLTEDIIVDKQKFLNVITADLNTMSQDDQGLYIFQYVLNNTQSTTLTLKDLLAEIDTYVASHPENLGAGSGCNSGWWPSGSSHGCCGNYNGCCWVWHPICYIHDKICAASKCKPTWVCFKGCKVDPDPLEVDSNPFSYIEDNTEIPSNGTVTLTHTFTTDELVPTPDEEEMMYCATLASINDGVTDSIVPIFLHANQHFYTSSNFTTYVSDGYYKFDMMTNSYYKIVNGKAVAIYQLTP